MNQKSNPIVPMDLKEFRDKGYLQEVNRLFFHGLGLALVLVDDEKRDLDSFPPMLHVVSYQEDPEGIAFGFNDPREFNAEQLQLVREKAAMVSYERLIRQKAREKALGAGYEKIQGWGTNNGELTFKQLLAKLLPESYDLSKIPD